MMEVPEKIVWSEARKKWLCFDDRLIDAVVNSPHFLVPTYDYADVEKKFGKDFGFTKQIIQHLPLANEGERHLALRKRMSADIGANLKAAIGVFKDSFDDKLARLDRAPGQVNLARPIIESVLKSNLVFGGIALEDDFDYADLTLILDDSQSIRSRVAREAFVQSLASRIGGEDRFYKLALISVGVNALISTILHSLIKILTSHSFEDLVSRKYFASTGIKYLERACVQDTVIGGEAIQAGERVRLYVESFEHADLTDAQRNRKFFATESSHSCIGMSYSQSVWKELLASLRSHFSDLRILGFDYRANDGIFNFPTTIQVDYSK